MPKSEIDKERLIEIANAVEKRPSLVSRMFSIDNTHLNIDCECEGQKFTGTNLPGTCFVCGKRVQDY